MFIILTFFFGIKKWEDIFPANKYTLPKADSIIRLHKEIPKSEHNEFLETKPKDTMEVKNDSI